MPPKIDEGMNTRNKNKGDFGASDNIIETIEKKFNEQNVNFKKFDDKVCNKFNSLSAEMSSIRSELDSLNSAVLTIKKRCDLYDVDLKNMRSTVTSIANNCAEVENNFINLKSTVNSLANNCAIDEFKNLKSIVNTLETNLVATDVLLLSVPNEVNAADAVNMILKTIMCNNITIVKTFRTGISKKNDGKNFAYHQCIPIIIKLHSGHERDLFFTTIASFRKNSKRSLCVKDIGCDGETKLYLHECLSASNKIILKAALEHKKNKLLASVYTLHGNIFVRNKPDGPSFKIQDLSTLEKK